MVFVAISVKFHGRFFNEMIATASPKTMRWGGDYLPYC